MNRPMTLSALLSLLVVSGCGDNSQVVDEMLDLSAEVDLAEPPDLGQPDLSTPDLSMRDFSMPDLSTPDLSMPDFSMPDLATCMASCLAGCCDQNGVCQQPSMKGCGSG